MQPTNFKESSGVIGPPESMTEDECSSIFCYRDKENTISCWKVSVADLAEIQKTGVIWLCIMGSTMPPVIVTAQSPFEE